MIPWWLLGLCLGVIVLTCVVSWRRGGRARTSPRPPETPPSEGNAIQFERDGEEATAPRLAWLAAVVVVSLAARLMLGWPWSAAIGLAALLVALGLQAWQAWVERDRARLDGQVADTVDLLVASLRAGGAMVPSLATATLEVRPPLRHLLGDVQSRLELGEDPQVVLASESRRAHSEGLRLFFFSLAVHWQIGGSLASSLATVGAGVRDRIELARRVRTQALEAQVSVIGILLVTYVLFYLSWKGYPDRIEAFLDTKFGVDIVAAVMLLQAVGIVWMTRISRIKIG